MAPDVDKAQSRPLIVSDNNNETSQALIERGALTKRPRVVIDEDDYVDSLSTIIERDYFPYVNELRLQRDFIEASASGNEDNAKECERQLMAERLRIARGFRPQNQGTSTEHNTSSEDDYNNGYASKEAQIINSNLSLDAFQAKYTSEDNKSFNDLLDRQNAQNRAVYEWQWGNNRIEGPQSQHNHKALDFEQNKLLQAAKGAAPMQQIAWKDDDRPNNINCTVDKPRNDLFFIPDRGSLSAETVANQRSKEIHPENTRLLPPVDGEGPSKIEIERAMRDFSNSEFATDDSGNPTVSGFTFVDENDFQVPSKPNKFNIKQEPSRESVHRRLLERRQKQQHYNNLGGLNSKGKRWTPSTTGTPTSRRQAALTPAGKRLLSRFSKTPVHDGSLSNFGDSFTNLTPKSHTKSRKSASIKNN